MILLTLRNFLLKGKDFKINKSEIAKAAPNWAA